jgi:hypothetical protein
MCALDAFSQRFADLLFFEFPTWRWYARYDDTPDIPKDTIYLIVPNSAVEEMPLYIWTEDEEVTVGWCGWHTHFGRWLGINDEEAYQQAMSMIHNIVEEKVIIVIHSNREGEVKSAGVLPFDEDLGDECAYLKAHPELQMCIRSWNGSYDRCIEA